MTAPGMQLATPSIGNNLPVETGETSSSAIAAREKAAVEARFLMAYHRPRVFDTCRLRLLSASERPKFAEVARYAKPVGNTKVTGLSVRFAEEARVLWGNMDVTTLLVFDDIDRRIYRVQAIDLETNATEAIDVMVEKFVERKKPQSGSEIIGSRDNSQGEKVYKIRATEDDLTVKVNAMIAKARRNAILSLLPADVKDECEDRIVATLKNRDAKDPEGARKAITESFYGMGVMPTQLAEMLGHPLEQLTPAELTLLRSYYTALKEGEATWQAIVEMHTGGKKSESGAAVPARGTEGIKSKLSPKKADAASAEPAAQAAAPANDAAAPTKCTVCFRTDGSHDPNAPCYDEAIRQEELEMIRREEGR